MPPPRRSRVRDLASLLALILAVVILSGWAIGAEVLVRGHPSWPVATPVTAMLAGAAALASLGAGHPRTRLAGRTLGALVALGAVAVLLDHATGWMGTWEGIPFTSTTREALSGAAPRPSPNSAVAFAALGVGVAIAELETVRWRRVAHACVLLASATVYLGLLGYATDTELLYAPSRAPAIGMSVPTIATVSLLTVALVLTLPRGPLVELLRRDRPGGQLLRVSVPVLLLAPIVVELLGRPLLRSGAVASRDIGAVMLAVLTVVAIATVATVARRLDAEARDRSAAEQRFSALLQRAPDAMLVVDDRGRITLVNEQACALFGYPEEALVGAPVETLVPESSRRRHVEHRTGYTAHPRVRTMAALQDIEGVRSDGTTFTAAISLSPTELQGAPAVLVSVRDVSRSRDLLAREVRRSTQLSALMDAMQAATGLLTTEEVATAIAGAARDLVGARGAFVRRRARAGGYALLGISGLTSADALAIDTDAPSHGNTVSSLKGPYDGDTEDTQLVVVPEPDQTLDDVDRATLGILGAFAAEVLHVADSFEDELRLVEQLQAIDRTKDTFLSAVSHELRTPLTVVVGLAQTLLRDDVIADRELHDELVTRLVDNGHRLDRLLSDLLDVDRLQRGVIEPRFRPRDVAEVVAGLLEHLTPALHRTVHPELVSVVAEVEVAQVERIVENLITNADRYAGADSPIWVRVGPSGADQVEILVEDAGPGVSASLREDIFRPFHRGGELAAHAPGIGIGLTLVQRFVELHGGTVEVGERPGGGASFRVRLPREHGDGGASSAHDGADGAVDQVTGP